MSLISINLLSAYFSISYLTDFFKQVSSFFKTRFYLFSFKTITSTIILSNYLRRKVVEGYILFEQNKVQLMFSSIRQGNNGFIENQWVKSKFEGVVTYLRNLKSFFYVFTYLFFKFIKIIDLFFWFVMKDVKIAIGIFMIIIDCAIRALLLN